MRLKNVWQVAMTASLAAQSCLAADRIVIDCSKTAYRTSPLFFGINTLFWIDDDASRADGSYQRAVSAIGARLLRFPAGTGGDNFHWRENKLDDINRFPYEDGPEKLDFDEFVALCRATGAEPIVVVNVGSWARKGDIAGGAAEAADWVRYSREKGYRVKYWEIGNEVYHHIQLGAREYAQLLVTYAKAMKAADPAILIGAVGHWDTQDVGAADRVDPAHRDELLKADTAAKGKDGIAAFKELAKQYIEKERRKGSPQWWPTLLDIAGPQIDFAVVHWYFNASLLPRLDGAIRELGGLINGRLGRRVPLALTEWNMGSQMQKGLTRFAHNLVVAEAAARFMDAGVTMATYWPARMKAGNYTLIAHKDNSVTETGKLFALLGRHTLARRVATVAAPADLYVFATASDDAGAEGRDDATSGSQLSILIFNQSKRALPDVTLELAGGPRGAWSASVHTETTPGGTPFPIRALEQPNTYSLSIPPRSYAVLSIP